MALALLSWGSHCREHLTAAALVDTAGGWPTAPDAFLSVLPRLPLFMLMWIAASCVVGFFLIPVVPGAVLYLGFSMVEVVFVAEGCGPFASLPRSWQVAWTPRVRGRIMWLTAAAFITWALPCAAFSAILGSVMTGPMPPAGMLREAFPLLLDPPLTSRSFSPPPSCSPPSSSPKSLILYRRAVLLYPPMSPAESPVKPPHVSA